MYQHINTCIIDVYKRQRALPIEAADRQTSTKSEDKDNDDRAMRVPSLVSLLLLLFHFLSFSTMAFMQYQLRLPNAQNVPNAPGLGHVDKEGGGALNAFGGHFKASKFVWTRELCEKDSDLDGESNGLELGDPCCVWNLDDPLTSTFLRQWSASHPGRKSRVSNVAMPNCTLVNQQIADKRLQQLAADTKTAEFWEFYFKNANNAAADGDSKEEEESIWADLWHSLSNTFLLLVTEPSRLWPSTFSLDFGTDGGTSIKDLFTFGVFTVSVLFLTVGRVWTKIKSMSWKQHLLMFVISYLYTDLLSALLHITLDNPNINDWPIVGSEARAFQGHHHSPAAITRTFFFFLLVVLVPFSWCHNAFCVCLFVQAAVGSNFCSCPTQDRFVRRCID